VRRRGVEGTSISGSDIALHCSAMYGVLAALVFRIALETRATRHSKQFVASCGGSESHGSHGASVSGTSGPKP
jgi:hypothetical protein